MQITEVVYSNWYYLKSLQQSQLKHTIVLIVRGILFFRVTENYGLGIDHCWNHLG